KIAMICSSLNLLRFIFVRLLRGGLYSKSVTFQGSTSIAAVLRTIPAPTETWASIIGHLAWPAVTLFLIVRFRAYLRLILDTLVSRLPHDNLKFGPFEMTANSEIYVLDPDEADESTYRYETEDIQRIERLFEFISKTENYDKLRSWLNQNVDRKLDVGDFLTLPTYANERQRAVTELAEEK
ncbi:MAG: hypothetical protein K2P79_05865, partial [Sphingomonas sp.]|nr:hypothetical protein [Sphingomonas sp.]